MDCGGISSASNSDCGNRSGDNERVGRSKKYPWDEQREARLLELCQSGVLYKQIAHILTEEFGEPLTRKACSSRANKRGFARQISWDAEHVEYGKQLLTDPAGYSHYMIAAKINAKFGTDYTRNSVIGRFHRMKVKREGVVKAKKPRAKETKPRQARLSIAVREEIKRIRCEAVEPLHVSLFDLNTNNCHWPYGDGPFTFCGHPKFQGLYCATHYFQSIGSGSAGERSALKISQRQLQGAW